MPIPLMMDQKLVMKTYVRKNDVFEDGSRGVPAIVCSFSKVVTH